MRPKLKPLNQQVVLITGASSGIGRQSALQFASAGAKVIAVARNAEALASLVQEIESAGGTAISATADVADENQLRAAAEAGITRFGHIDTWVNDAGVGLYTKIIDTDVADDRRLFDTNFWGVVNGSRIAVPYLKSIGGGALINLGSEVSDVAIPIQGMYAASKHAIMGFTDALREEIMADGLPISVTLIKPAAINTPFAKHAKNNLDQDATLPSPVYATKVVADQILYAAEYGGRDLYAGGGGRLMGFLGRHFPTASDYFMSTLGISQQLADRLPDKSYDGLHSSRGFHRTDGDVQRDRHIQHLSLYGVARRHPLTTTVAAVALAATVGVVLSSKKLVD